MKPSTTTDGARWVSSFEVGDQRTAALLIDSLEMHDHVEIMNTLRDQILAIADADVESLPMLVLPIRSLEDLPRLGEDEEEHIAYRTYDPGAPLPILPGSEADIGSMSRGIIESDAARFLPPSLNIDELRRRKVRTICLVTDYSGSGNQAIQFVRTFKANSTIASWISYGLVRLYVVTYAAGLEASELFKAERHVTFRSHLSAKSARSAGWSDDERGRIEELCLREFDSDDHSGALGYKNSFGLYLTNMRVPNNLPQILIKQAGKRPGIFANRLIPHGFHQELGSYSPSPSLDTTLRNLGAGDLADRLSIKTRPVRSLRALAALYLIEYGISEEQVWAMLGLDPNGIREIRTTLLALECITLDNKLTKRGKAELHRARSLGVDGPKHVHKPRPPVSYEPTQLR